MGMGRTIVTAMLLLAASSAWAATITDEQRIKNPDGSTAAVIVTCNSCGPNAKPGETCLTGAAEGFLNCERCGPCLMDSNFGFRAGHAYDLQFIGHLKDASGKPVNNQFVRVVEPNGWAFTTRTSQDGMFRIMVGATLDRAGNPAQNKDLGTLTIQPKSGKEGAVTFYVLPEQFKPCAPPKPKKKP